MGSKLAEHFGYVSDRVRLDCFRLAIGSLVKSADRVADLGCGSGILGLLSLQAGAAHVVFVDDASMIDLAQATMERAGLAGRCSFIRGRSQQVELSERVDVVLCDHVGWFGVDYGLIELLQDARRRFLKAGGALIPASVRLQLALAEAPLDHSVATQWGSDDVPPAYRWVREAGLNKKYPIQVERRQLLGAPVDLGEIDLRAEIPNFLSFSAETLAERDGVVHGLCGWFDCALAPGVRMTNSPLAESRIQRPQVFLPMEEPVAVRTGDPIEISVMTRPGDDLLVWNTAFPRTGRRFRQSTWHANLAFSGSLARGDQVPLPRAAALARRIVLGYCDGHRTAREVEDAVLLEHPLLFPSPRETRRFVSKVLREDTD